MINISWQSQQGLSLMSYTYLGTVAWVLLAPSSSSSLSLVMSEGITCALLPQSLPPSPPMPLPVALLTISDLLMENMQITSQFSFLCYIRLQNFWVKFTVLPNGSYKNLTGSVCGLPWHTFDIEWFFSPSFHDGFRWGNTIDFKPVSRYKTAKRSTQTRMNLT